ncbi:MAG: response regulator [Verrucomicrobiota bacterium]
MNQEPDDKCPALTDVQASTKNARLARIRHDLKTPINHILGYSDMLLEESCDEAWDKYDSDLEKILNAGRQLLTQVRYYFDDSQTRPAKLDLPRVQHEFRTPLNHIIGYAEILIEQAEEFDDTIKIKDLERVITAAKTLLELLEAHLIVDASDILQNEKIPDISWPSVPVAAASPIDVSEPAWNNATILVVDDDPLNRDLMERRLARQGCKTLSAESGPKAIEMLRSESVDLVLLDMIMPEMDGFEILSKLKSDTTLSRIPVVMLSASDETSTTVHCIKMGADDFLPKPCNTTLLLARVESALAKKQLQEIQRKETGFFHDKGTLRADARSYVERKADRELVSNLLASELWYVLTSRQMGKSSLMVRSAARLREQGIGVVVLDLTAVGQNVTPEQWYDGLLNRAARQLRLEDEMEDYWFKYERLSPVQRLFGALRDIAMEQYSGALVLFVDEVDAVRSLPFATDEFFAAMRECFNRRAEDAAFHRLTFCLLGVAKPDDLISDERSTPFNIAHRIELSDFEPEAIKALADGLNREANIAGQLLERVFHWTNGHPYLTQRLCRSIAEDTSVQQKEDVDALCENLFLTSKAQEEDDNLNFVRRWLLASGTPVKEVMESYQQILTATPVPMESIQDSVLHPLRLSGIISIQHQGISVRNRIYARSFNEDWVRRQLSDL